MEVVLQIRNRLAAACLALLAITGSSNTRGAEVLGLDVHGSLSLTTTYSDQYNFLGDNGREVDLNVVEGLINAQYRFGFGVRAAAQVYVYQLDDYSAADLDYGNLSYSFTDWFSISVGRNKLPMGLYGEIQDIDIVHPFAFLPLANYPKSYRAFVSSYDGLGINGTINLKKAGSLDYKLFGGWHSEVDKDAPFVRSLSQLTPLESATPGHLFGAWLYYNLPIQGLRIGGSILDVPKTRSVGVARKKKEIRYQASDSRTAPDQVDGQFNAALAGAGLSPQMIDYLYGEDYSYWDANIAGHRVYNDADFRIIKVSAEYVRERFSLAVEYSRTDVKSHSTGIMAEDSRDTSDGIFGMATFKATNKLEFGAYADFSWRDESDRSGTHLRNMPKHYGYTRDYAIAASYKIRDWWNIKAEAHLIDGTSMLQSHDRENGDPGKWSERWNLFVLKTTLSF